MKNEIKKAETTFDIDDAMVEIAASVYVTLSRLSNLYASVHPAIVWNENAGVREARRISSEVKTVIDNLQNTEGGLTYETIDREIDRLSRLYASVHPAIVWNETDAVREARRISSEVEYIKNKLIDIKALGHKIDVYYAEAEPGSEA